MNARVRILDGLTALAGLAAVALPSGVPKAPLDSWAHVLAGLTIAAFAGYALARTRRGLPRGWTPHAAAAVGAVMLALMGSLPLAAAVALLSLGAGVPAGSRGGKPFPRATASRPR